MKSLIRNALLAGFAVAAMTLPAHALGSAALADGPLFKSKTMQLAIDQCFTDDGYGRMRPCDSLFRAGPPKK